MRLRKLMQDDDAVSPVIGVILMVAITVILAAVIASFVLGLGNQAGEVAPQGSFNFDYNTADNNVTVTYQSGDSIPALQLKIRGDGINRTPPIAGPSGNQTWAAFNGTMSGEVEGQTAVVGGDSVKVPVDNAEYDIRIVWESDSGETTSTLADDSGPQA